MTAATLTPDAKEHLRKTIRALRERLLRDIPGAADGAYRLSVKADQAGLSEAQRIKRGRLEAWLDEQMRSAPAKERNADSQGLRARFFLDGVKEAAHTLLNRLVFLRYAEALGLSAPKVVTGGWRSQGYKEFREFSPALCDDETQGYGVLLHLVFNDLSLELPGLFGNVGVTALFPVPPSTLRHVIEELDAPELAPAWTDDTTLGWVFQFYNDPEREALDARINDGKKVEPHEIAGKTQMFTERYMVEWLLHNTVGQMWLAMCAKHGWTPDAKPVLDALDVRRVEFRKQRESGAVALDALMPMLSALEERWKYWVPQPMPADSVTVAPASLRDLKLLDPACGSGHFVVVAFDLLAALYQEEARHRRETWSNRQIAEWIVHENLHGIDIDPRAVQIAAAALWAKAMGFAKDAKLRRMNLVAPALRLGALSKDDPALVRLEQDLEREVGLPAGLTEQLLHGLAGVDHLGTLLKVDHAIESALVSEERMVRGKPTQGDLFRGMPAQQLALTTDEARATVLDRIERFLEAHAAEQDLGLRLEGEQLAAGVRFVRMVRESTYDIVVGNPPYQGTSRMRDTKYVAQHYPRGKADLCAAFLERGLELVKDGGLSALLTMRGWLFLSQFEGLREHLLQTFDIRCIGDFDRGAFDDVPNEVLAVAASVFRKAPLPEVAGVALQPTPSADKSYDRQRTNRKRAAVLAQVGRYEFDARGFGVIEGEPVVYWWSKEFLDRYAKAPKLGSTAPIRYGLSTQNNTRWLRQFWEVRQSHIMLRTFTADRQWTGEDWVPYIKGAVGRTWFDSTAEVLLWRGKGLELATYPDNRYGRGTTFYFKRGVAFVNVGMEFSARVHRVPSIFGHVAGSVFDTDVGATVCLLNSRAARDVMASLNPGVHFLTTDVERLPIVAIDQAPRIFSTIESAFSAHESARESSVEFRCPAASPWRHAQAWAQLAVDRPEGAALPPYVPELDPPEPKDFVSYAVGVALGRFGAAGEGILETAPPEALPAGILFVSSASEHDSVEHPACARVRSAWAEYRAGFDGYDDVRDYLRRGFFKDDHRQRYDNRPIYFPLSSKQRGFVAFVSIHRWTDQTLQTLLADHLLPEKRRLDGEIDDLREARASADKKQQREAEKRFAVVKKLNDELDAFIASVRECAEKGPPPADPKFQREVDAAFRMDLDDGVMINSAALWPLLEPQWKDPPKWWGELARADGKKDYDWAHLASRYFPKRVDEKCRNDPSLGVAHGCFWKYHAAKAYAWELRLQDEIGPAFRINEEGADQARSGYLAEHPEDARAILEKEQKRRERKHKQAEESDEPLYEDVAS